ncbi:helix-turn-helix domain-containing protein [Tenacibaculum piscium]|nr:helix-turn-helix domain-containing protein [Tenacibaculum piscium]MCG8183675.1 helix-turn-helix transcriptional regulator [Tenacibaculum piscium]MCG8204838.1 helix-turn-helix transcriptional regulator [Tenacibaculum piscium]
MNTKDIFDLFLIVSALHGFAFNIILLCSKNGREKSMLYLNLLIFVISLNNIQSWGLERNLLQHKFTLNYLQIPWHFLAMPFLYMFLIHYLKIAKKSYNLLKIILPMFLVIVITQVIFMYNYNVDDAPEKLNRIYEQYSSFEEGISLLVSLIIFSYSFFVLNRKEKIRSKILTFDSLKWLHTFFKLTAVGYVLWLFALGIKIKLNFTSFIFSYYPLRVYTTLLIYWVGYQGLRQLRISKERKQIRKSLLINLKLEELKKSELKETLKEIPLILPISTVNHQPITTSTPAETVASNTEKNSLAKQKEQFLEIDTFINNHKKFLLAKYTLQNLSKDIKLSSSTLSLIINNVADKSFTDYINEKKVAQAKIFLLDANYSNYTITSIGLESGFNSKSTFFTVFKKLSGYTPVQFKKEQLLKK